MVSHSPRPREVSRQDGRCCGFFEGLAVVFVGRPYAAMWRCHGTGEYNDSYSLQIVVRDVTHETWIERFSG